MTNVQLMILIMAQTRAGNSSKVARSGGLFSVGLIINSRH